MSIYFKIANTTYKLPNRTIVGRGEPFTQFNDDHSVARSHFVIIRKKNGIYIKDLGSKSGTYLNGKKIPKNKIVKWSEGYLKVGTHEIGMSQEVPDSDCVQVSAIKGHASGGLEYFKWGMCLVFGFVVIVTLADGEVGPGSKLFNIIFSAAFLSGIFKCYKFIFKLITPKNMIITDIFLGEDGFTVHYDAGGNMTLKLAEMDEWKRYMGGANVRMKSGEVYCFFQMQNRERIVEYFTKHVPELENQDKQIDYRWQMAAGAALGCIVIYFLKMEILTDEALFGLSLAAVVFTVAFSKNKWAPNNRYINNKKFAQMGGGIAILMLVGNWIGPSDQQMALLSQTKCSMSANGDCKRINYELITLKETDIKKATLACDLGNKSACNRMEKKADLDRLPASAENK